MGSQRGGGRAGALGRDTRRAGAALAAVLPRGLGGAPGGFGGALSPLGPAHHIQQLPQHRREDRALHMVMLSESRL